MEKQKNPVLITGIVAIAVIIFVFFGFVRSVPSSSSFGDLIGNAVRGHGFVTLNSVPGGARASFYSTESNRVAHMRTPIARQNLRSGTYDLVIRLEGYPEYSQKGIIIKRQEVTDLGVINIQNVPPSCTDTDPADSPLIRGKVYGTNSQSTDYSHKDSCTDVSPTKYVEQKCIKDTSGTPVPQSQILDCPQGLKCKKGVCA